MTGDDVGNEVGNGVGNERNSMPRGPVEGLGDLSRLLTDEQMATFLRGLTVGALIGAAIAGSRIWQRQRRKRRSPGDGR